MNEEGQKVLKFSNHLEKEGYWMGIVRGSAQDWKGKKWAKKKGKKKEKKRGE